MHFLVSKILPEIDIVITGSSYAGTPRDNTMMYITKKVDYLIDNLKGHSNIICFVDKTMNVPRDIENSNEIIRVDNPAYEYASFATNVANIVRTEKKQGYHLADGGYYLGDDVSLGKNVFIEPGAIIGHGVSIGDDSVILAGSVIKNSLIGNNFFCSENAVIGNNSFTMAVDDEGNKYRIPSLGRVVIGNHVEVGACNDIARGACGDTILEDYVKLDGLVHVGHEAHLEKNVEITAGAIVAGFAELGEEAYLGVNSCLKNRISIGAHCIVGMGAVVTKTFGEGNIIIGNPGHKMEKK